MLVVVFILAVIVAVAAGLIAWSRGREGAPLVPKTPTQSCPDCGSPFVHGKDLVCKKCGRNLEAVAPSVRKLADVTDDDENDPQSRTVVKTSRAALMRQQCQSCGAALEGLSECPKCGAKQTA